MTAPSYMLYKRTHVVRTVELLTVALGINHPPLTVRTKKN